MFKFIFSDARNIFLVISDFVNIFGFEARMQSSLFLIFVINQ